VESLDIQADDIAPTTLPLHYTYGLSVVNSHLEAGGAVLLTEASVVARPFWAQFRRWGATSLAGVPWTWQSLQRLRLERMELPTLRTMTQAGGRLATSLVQHFAGVADARGARFFVMYGQTEATARIAVLPPEHLRARPDTVG